MEKWALKVKGNTQEIINKLNSALESADGFVYNMNQDKDDSAVFNMHKRVKYPDQILHRNRVNVNGKIIQTDTNNETGLEIIFSQHIFMKLTVWSIIISGLGLIAIISRMSINPSMYILAGILLAVGIIFWFTLQQKFAKDIQKYKTFISEILES